MKSSDLPKNIYYTPNGKNYRVIIRHTGKQVNLGVFTDLDEAKKAVKEFRKIYPNQKGKPWKPGDPI